MAALHLHSSSLAVSSSSSSSSSSSLLPFNSLHFHGSFKVFQSNFTSSFCFMSALSYKYRNLVRQSSFEAGFGEIDILSYSSSSSSFTVDFIEEEAEAEAEESRVFSQKLGRIDLGQGILKDQVHEEEEVLIPDPGDQMGSNSSESSEEETDEDESFDQITRISVPKEKYIPVSKVSLVKALCDSFNDEEKASEFLVICSLLDFILHAEHKTTLEQMRLDYKITRSILKKEEHEKNTHSQKPKRSKKKGWWEKINNIWNRKEKKKKRVAQKKSPYEINGGNGSMSSGDELPVENGSAMHISSPTPKEQEFSLPLIHGSNGTISTKNSVDEDANPDVTTRKSIAAAAARFQRNFLKLLKNAHFQGLSVRDLQLTSALNTDYLLTLPIEVDWKNSSSEIAIIFRRGYAAERQEGLLFGAKLDYIQSLLLRKILNWLSRPLFNGGTWINKQLKQSREEDGSRNWAEDITEWLKEPLKPDMDDDLSSIIADSLTQEEKEDYLPVWIAAQQAVPRYEAFLSSVGSRGVLLRRLLVWMRILPPPDLEGILNVEDDSSGSSLARISMRDIWLPASKMVCGTDLWHRLKAAFSVFFSRSTLQEPAYKELVLLYNVPNDDADDIPNLQLKIYGKIPIPDLKVIFPNKKLSYRILDTVRLDIATIIGLLAFVINYRFDDFLSSPSAFLLDIIASSALIVYLSRVVLGYKQTFDRYQLLVNKTLYEKTLASGFGAVHFLVDASEQQEFKESILAFAMLMQANIVKVETRESLCMECEQFLLSHFKEQVEMPIDEALKTLSRLGLVMEKKTASSNSADLVEYPHILPNRKPVEVLQNRWNELLEDGSMSTTFLSSLYHNYRTKQY